ncbi:MAG: hypothetical protein H7A35_04105 [Planctomycetales bacterium]|nr:hypothetical protein [bacterium]UNM09239.1 MAG: hypothetical protein H7A35_04105 [Planctomycetales bacterium]
MARFLFNFCILLLAAAMLAACSGEHARPASGQEAQPGDGKPPVSLPPLETLDSLGDAVRSISSSKLELLGTAAILQTDNGVAQLPGFLNLDISGGAPVWAMFSAAGLEPGGEVVPSGLLTVFNKPVYVALADFGSGRWQWTRRASIGTLPITDGGNFVSPSGKVYVVVLAWEQSSDLSALELQFSGEVPASPQPQLHVPDSIVAGYELEYDATGSTAGSGALVTGVSYDFGDSTGTTLALSPDDKVTHVYEMPGTYTVGVRIDNDLGYSGYASQQVEVTAGVTELLVVCNSLKPDSQELADYYMSPVTGRGIAIGNRLELPIDDADIPEIDRQQYESEIRDPIKEFIDANGIKASLKYILLMDGLPHQIPGVNGGDYNQSTFSSVDSELCTLFSDDTYAYASFLWNEEQWQDFGLLAPDFASFYIGMRDLDTDYSFSHGQYKVTDSGGTKYDLDYLVGRLDAYDLADAKALVDRSKAADTSGNGWVVYDTTPARFPLDTMSDPVWPFTEDGDALSGDEWLTAAAYNHFIDLSTTRIIGQESDGMPAGSVDNVIAYAGWGVNHSGGSYPSGNLYILDDLLFTYLPGCAWISYESFNGTDFDSATVDGDRSDINRKGQGQICDFLHRGGSVAIGHVYEPWTIAVGDERAVFYRYCVKGDNWIESAYKGLRCLSWMDVVVGDPLCQVK